MDKHKKSDNKCAEERAGCVVTNARPPLCRNGDIQDAELGACTSLRSVSCIPAVLSPQPVRSVTA
jgi:hypothetical protein